MKRGRMLRFVWRRLFCATCAECSMARVLCMTVARRAVAAVVPTTDNNTDNGACARGSLDNCAVCLVWRYNLLV